jgi:hypothetical protein
MNKLVWVGRVISGLVGAAFVASGAMKFVGGPQLEEGFAHLGLPMSMRLPLGVLELTCAVIYLIPQTAVLGAVLLAGYVGGAMCTHWRVGDPFVVQTLLGLLAWLGIYLRESRLKPVLPVRQRSA